MQISFDPLDQTERDAIYLFMQSIESEQSSGAVTVRVPREVATVVNNVPASQVERVLADAASTFTAAELAPVSAAPLAPPAPSTAAADLFSTAPAAPQAGIPMPPGADVPPAPPVPQPPAAPPAPATSTSPAGDVDAAGLPWDERVHSSSKEKNKDGTWRQRRNLAEGVREKVEAELRGEAPPLSTAAPSVTPPAPPVEAPAPVAPAPDSSVSPSVDAPNVPPAPPTSAPTTVPTPTPPAPPAVTAAAPSAPATGVSFALLMQKITKGIAERKFDEAFVHSLLLEVGLQPSEISKLASAESSMSRDHIAGRIEAL